MSTTKEQRQEVAQTIAQQLGGLGRLKAFLGASQFVALENGLQFKFKGSRKFNTCRVILDPSDTYTVEFGQYRPSKLDYVKKEEFDGIYCDQLVELFESTTGLYLSF